MSRKMISKMVGKIVTAYRPDGKAIRGTLRRDVHSSDLLLCNTGGKGKMDASTPVAFLATHRFSRSEVTGVFNGVIMLVASCHD